MEAGVCLSGWCCGAAVRQGYTRNGLRRKGFFEFLHTFPKLYYSYKPVDWLRPVKCPAVSPIKFPYV